MNEPKKVAVKESTHVAAKTHGKATGVKAPQMAKGTPKHSQKISINPEQRDEMIAETAYYRAEQRGFSGGDPIVDWLWAEAEIDKEP